MNSVSIYEDYFSYISEHQKTVELLKKKLPNIYVLVEDVIKVTDYIWKEYDNKSKISDELAEIFEIGFGYLTNVLADLEAIFQEYFNNMPDKINYYAPLIIYSVYLEDYRCHLETEEILTDSIKERIDEIQEEIDSIMNKSLPFDITLIDKYEDEVLSMVTDKTHFQPVYVVFAMICEELDLI